MVIKKHAKFCCFGFLSIEDRDQQIVSDFYVFLGGKTYLFCLASISVHLSEKFCNCNSLYILSMYSSKLGMLLYYHMKIRLFIVMKVWLNYFWRSCCPFGGNQSTRRKPQTVRPVVSYWQTLSHNVVLSTPSHDQDSDSQLEWW
jgi:hypothetical protein